MPRGREHLGELVQKGVEPEQLVAPVGEEILAKGVAAVHLEHQAAEVAELLLARPQELPALAADDAGRWKRATRLGVRRAAEAAPKAHRPRRV